MSIRNENVFLSSKPIKYIFSPSKENTDHLVVVFSAFSPKNTPTYNYVRTLQNIDVNKLFILDDQGDRGCYYLGKNRVFDVESSVVSLITNVAYENGVDHKNIISCGSSKGGYAALYFGIKYGFGHVIAGAPQTKLGTYLRLVKEFPTFEFISGDCSEDSQEFLDSLLYGVVSKVERMPNIIIHVGTGDTHYKSHVIPFKEHLESFGFKCELDIVEYIDHGDVSYYQKLLVAKIIDIVPTLKNSLRITNIEVDAYKNNFTIKTITNKKALYAWYVYKNNKRVHVEWYRDNNDFTFSTVEPGTYYFISFVKDTNGFIITEKTQEYIVEL